MAVFESLDSLINGAVLATLPAWLTGYGALQSVLTPAAGAELTVRPAGSTTDTVPVLANRDGSGGALAQPITADADGRVPGWVSMPQQLDVYVSRSGSPDLLIEAGRALDRAVYPVLVAAGNLGASYVIDFAALAANDLVIVAGTLNANCTIVFVNQQAGNRVRLLLTQDGVGGHSATVVRGSVTQQLAIDGAPSSVSTVNVDFPTTTRMVVDRAAEPDHANARTTGYFLDFGGGAPGAAWLPNDVGLTDTRLTAINVVAGTTAVYEAAPSPQTLRLAFSATAGHYYGIFRHRGAQTRDTYGRVNISMDALPANEFRFVAWQQAGPGKGTIGIATNGKVRVGSVGGGGGAPFPIFSTTVLSTAHEYWIEWYVHRSSAAGATDGYITVTILDSDQATVIETFTTPPFDTGNYVDTIQIGHVLGGALGTVVHLGAVAVNCLTPPGPYNGPEAPVWQAVSQDGSKRYAVVSPAGEFAVLTRAPHSTDKGGTLHPEGSPALRVHPAGHVLIGEHKSSDPDEPFSGPGVPGPGFDAGTGRAHAESITLYTPNDPPDFSGSRIGNINNEMSGSDGVVSAGNLFSAASLGGSQEALRASDVNRGITVGGTLCYFQKILGPSSALLMDSQQQPVSLASASGLTWSISMTPYPHSPRGVAGTTGPQLRSTPFVATLIRSGNDLTITAATTGSVTLSFSGGGCTSADTGRWICLADDATRIYKLTYVDANTLTGAVTAASPSNEVGHIGGTPTYVISGSTSDPNARAPAFWGGHLGYEMRDGTAAVAFAGDQTRDWVPTDLVVSLARAGEFYPTAQGMPPVWALRYDGYNDVYATLALGDNTHANASNAWRDAMLSRFRTAVAGLVGFLDATGKGIATRIKAGAPADADLPAGAYVDGAITADSLYGGGLYLRSGGVHVRQPGLVTDTHANRIAVATPPANLLWKETDTGLIYRGNGSGWDIWKGDGAIRKTADQSVQNIGVLGNVTDLVWPVEQNEVWVFKLILFLVSSSLNADWQAKWVLPSGGTTPTMRWGILGRPNDFAGGVGFGTPTTVTGVNASRNEASVVNWGALGGAEIVQMIGRVRIGSSAGTVQFQIAQLVATNEVQTVEKDSYIDVRRLV